MPIDNTCTHIMEIKTVLFSNLETRYHSIEQNASKEGDNVDMENKNMVRTRGMTMSYLFNCGVISRKCRSA